MSVTTRRYTYDDLANTPDDGNRYEIIGGELIVSPAPFVLHQQVISSLGAWLSVYVMTRRLGQVLYAPTDVRISDDNVVEPDIFYVSRERLAIIEQKYVAGAPDLVIEVLSPGTRRIDLGRKKALYAAAGVQEYWIADPSEQSLVVWSLGDGEYQAVQQPEGMVRSQVVPGFEIALEDAFGGL